MGDGLLVYLMHLIIYKFYVIDIFFLNIYLLLGLVGTVSFLYIFKLWNNPITIHRLFIFMRFNF